MSPDLPVETRFRIRIVLVVMAMIILAQPYAMFWQAVDMNGNISWLFDQIGISWAFTASTCGGFLVIIGLCAGLWGFSVSLRDVSLDRRG